MSNKEVDRNHTPADAASHGQTERVGMNFRAFDQAVCSGTVFRAQPEPEKVAPGTPDVSPAKAADRAKTLFFSQLPLILARKEYILHERELASTVLPFSEVGTFLTGGRQLTLGHLLTLWSDGGWRQPCPDCGGSVYVFLWGGSAATGANRWSGWCPDCGQEVRSSACPSHGEWIRPALHPIWEPGTLSLEDCLQRLQTGGTARGQRGGFRNGIGWRGGRQGCGRSTMQKMVQTLRACPSRDSITDG